MVWKQGASVAIWGSGLNAEKVYVKYAGKYDIRIVVDNFKNKEIIFNKKIVSAEEFFSNDEFRGLKIIIASDKWKEIVEQLRGKGLRAGEDFLPYVMLDTREILVTTILGLCRANEIAPFLESMRENRQMAVFWGNCQMNGVREFCKNNMEFCKKYLVLTFPNLWRKEELLECCDCKEIWEKCELLIIQKIRYENKFNVRFSTEYRKNFMKECGFECEIVLMPNLYFDGYYPQLGKERVVALGELQYEGVECRDSNIIQMLDKGMADKEIVEKLESEDYYSYEEIIEHFEKCLHRFKKNERECTIQIGDYLKQKKILYYSPMHPHAELVYQLTIRLLEYLKIVDIRIDNVERIKTYMDNFFYFHRTEYVYPCVLKALEITAYEEVYRVNTIIFNEDVCGRDVLEYYIAICKGYKGKKEV